MSIVTLCPQCKTAFAIQAEHYSAADAWVRCGRCAHVFEVDQHLFEIDPTQGETETPVKESPVVDSPVAIPMPDAAVPLTPPVWQPVNPPNSALAVVVTLLASAVLLGQVLVFQRDKLVAMNLSVSPFFISACQVLGCRVDWPKEPEKVAIDSTNFKQLGEDQFSFTLSVKNQAAYFLGSPALELTLTNDAQGDMVRKVWLAQEIDLPSVLKPLRTQTVEIIFSVEQPLAGKINGYRALLFYP
jgi:predicted Zn finger-like uncharacterized protein